MKRIHESEAHVCTTNWVKIGHSNTCPNTSNIPTIKHVLYCATIVSKNLVWQEDSFCFVTPVANASNHMHCILSDMTVFSRNISYLILSYVRLRGRLVTYYPPLFTVRNCFSHFRTLVVAVNMAHACAGAPGVIKVEEFLGWQETGRGIFSRDKPDPAPMCLPPELSFRQCEQLLEVAPPVQETKYAIALEVYGRLLNLECDKQIAAAVLWFTGIHTESKEWAAIHL